MRSGRGAGARAQGGMAHITQKKAVRAHLRPKPLASILEPSLAREGAHRRRAVRASACRAATGERVRGQRALAQSRRGGVQQILATDGVGAADALTAILMMRIMFQHT